MDDNEHTWRTVLAMALITILNQDLHMAISLSIRSHDSDTQAFAPKY